MTKYSELMAMFDELFGTIDLELVSNRLSDEYDAALTVEADVDDNGPHVEVSVELDDSVMREKLYSPFTSEDLLETIVASRHRLLQGPDPQPGRDRLDQNGLRVRANVEIPALKRDPQARQKATSKR